MITIRNYRFTKANCKTANENCNLTEANCRTANGNCNPENDNFIH